MKKLFFLLLIPFVFACSDSDDYKEDIVGTWKADIRNELRSILTFDKTNVHSEEWIKSETEYELLYQKTQSYILTSKEITYPDNPTSNVRYKLKGDKLSILTGPSVETDEGWTKETWTDYVRVKD